MTNKLAKLSIKKIAIFRALQIGDLLCTIPAIRSLKATFPDAEITLIGLPWAKNFVRRFSNYFSDFIEFPGYPGLPERVFDSKKYLQFIQKIQKEDFDLVIQMQGNGTIVNAMIESWGTKKSAGFFNEHAYKPNELYMEYPEFGSEISRHLQLMKFLGIPSLGDDLEFPLTKQEEANAEKIVKENNLQKNAYAVVHAGARDTKRWWEPERFAKVADKIASQGLQIILTGTAIEEQNVSEVQRRMKTKGINIVGQTDLGTFAAIIKNAKMLLSNDTGASHIAACVKTPSIVVFLASDPNRWAPLNKELHHIVLPQEAKNMRTVITKTQELLHQLT